MKPARATLALALALAFAGAVNAQWNTELSSPGGAEQLRLGVIAYNQGRISESILLFEKALAWDPGEPIILDWLGKAYYRSGFESTALTTWAPLLSLPDAPSSLTALVETIRARRALDIETTPPRYIEAHRFEGHAGSTPQFLRPASLLPQPDGSFYVVAQGSEQVLRLDPNGLVKQRISGGLDGLDRPFGIAKLADGSLMISEFNGDRITKISSAGTSLFFSTGRGGKQLLGPQFMTIDGSGYIYVTDFGNARVLKFDPDGQAILTFGGPSGDFLGFHSPTGIAWVNGNVYVADSEAKTIYSFDESGNYVGSLADGQLHFPEGLSSWEGGQALLVADSDRVVSIDLGTERLDEIYRSPDAKPRITSAVADYMGGILACDFNNSSVSVLNESSDLARGFDVEISRVDASSFPLVRVSADVKDRWGRPVVGLNAANFYLSETLHARSTIKEAGKPIIKTSVSIAPAKKVEFLGSGTTTPGFRCVALIERSPAMALAGSELASLLGDFASALQGDDRLGAVSAGRVPTILQRPTATPNLAALVRALRVNPETSGRFDLGLRQAVNTLMPSGVRDAVVYFSSGSLDDASLQSVSLSELAALLTNNGIAFYVVLIGDGNPDASLRYLVKRSGGSFIRAEAPRGIKDLPTLLRSAPSGRYEFSFESADDPDFGERQMTVALEAWLFHKSGRDEIGYYAPLR